MYQLVDLQVKSSMKLQNVFRRVSQVSRGASDTVDGDEKEKKVGELNLWNFCQNFGLLSRNMNHANYRLGVCLADPLPICAEETEEQSFPPPSARC